MNRLFKTREIKIGNLLLGGSNPILVQSMTTTDTKDVEKTLEQIKALVDVGCDLVRVTVPTMNDVMALEQIKNKLLQENIRVPLCADVHFVPAAALKVCEFVDKVRINPGNFADRKMFKVQEYTDDQYTAELKRIEEKFLPLVEKLKKYDCALRIGTNHGSLSDRVMNRYGDSPAGMVESAFEFAAIARNQDFHHFCFSMKASNVGVMVNAYRLLVQKQLERNWDYPIHLGVTEAGDGEDGRLKSCIGIGTLLAEGIGDTIRVSLTESSVKEIPVARALANRFPRNAYNVRPMGFPKVESPKLVRRPPSVWVTYQPGDLFQKSLQEALMRPDFLLVKNEAELSDAETLAQTYSTNEAKIRVGFFDGTKVSFRWEDSEENVNLQLLSATEVLETKRALDPQDFILTWSPGTKKDLDRVLEASLSLGSAFVDQAFSGILIKEASLSNSTKLAYGILQATRRRMSKTEYISCPSCGRTLFDLEETTAQIKKRTDHLKGVKIGIMGCIVNGPGEMADADFGFVGGAPGKVNLYVGMDCVKRNIAFDQATDELVQLIKDHGRWVEPSAASAG